MISIALNILDLIQNSLRAGASSISTSVEESGAKDKMELTIRDNGAGMSPELVEAAYDPFFTTRITRRTGMGIPLMKYHTGLAGGEMRIESSEGRGTTVFASFVLDNIDRQPLGDIAGVMTILMAANPEVDFIYTHRTDKGRYRFSSKETKEYLEVEVFNDNKLLTGIREMINNNLTEIGAADFTLKNIKPDEKQN